MGIKRRVPMDKSLKLTERNNFIDFVKGITIFLTGGADKNLDSHRALERSLFVYSYEKKSIALKVFHQ